MKLIAKRDLILLLDTMSKFDMISIKTLEAILDVYGDDYFVVDGVLEKTNENLMMKNVRIRGSVKR